MGSNWSDQFSAGCLIEGVSLVVVDQVLHRAELDRLVYIVDPLLTVEANTIVEHLRVVSGGKEGGRVEWEREGNERGREGGRGGEREIKTG